MTRTHPDDIPAVITALRATAQHKDPGYQQGVEILIRYNNGQLLQAPTVWESLRQVVPDGQELYVRWHELGYRARTGALPGLDTAAQQAVLLAASLAVHENINLRTALAEWTTAGTVGPIISVLLHAAGVHAVVVDDDARDRIAHQLFLDHQVDGAAADLWPGPDNRYRDRWIPDAEHIFAVARGDKDPTTPNAERRV